MQVASLKYFPQDVSNSSVQGLYGKISDWREVLEISQKRLIYWGK